MVLIGKSPHQVRIPISTDVNSTGTRLLADAESLDDRWAYEEALVCCEERLWEFRGGSHTP
jgi:hypothetical protein